MPLSLSEHSSAAEPIAAAAARQCRRRRRKTRRAGVYKAGETAAGGAGKGGAAVGEAAFLPRPAAGAALRRLLAWLTAARILRRNTLELFPPEAFAEEVVHRRSLGRDQIILSQPAAIHRILVENPHNYGRTAATVRILRPLLGEGLLLSEGEEWARQRRAHAPAFAPRMVPLLARRVAEAAEATIAELAAADGAPVDLLAALQKLALDVAGRVLFSLDMRPFAAPLRALVERYGDGLGRPRLLDFLLPPAVPSPHDLLRRRLRRRWLALVARIIAARRALPEPDPPDLFALLAAANAAAGGGEQRLVDQVATMLLAGHETTAAALFWAVLLLCDDPAAAARIRAEAAGCDLGPDGAAASLPALAFTRAVVHEALRLYPPAFAIVRVARGDDRAGDIAVPAGTVVLIAPWVLHRHRRLWREPERFDPTRFLPGAPPPGRFQYMPFGIGPRVCIGAQFALTEATLVLARLVAAFDIARAGREPVTPVAIVTTQPDHHPLFRLHRRRPAAAAAAP
jgi:cytochrome P450